MEILLLILGILLLIGGVAGCIVPAIPGPPFSFIGMLLLQWSGYADFSTWTLVLWGILATIVTIIDFLVTTWMTKRFGGSKAGNWGATIGMIVGMILPIPGGILVGLFAGAMIGEMVFSKQNTDKSLKVAFGALLSFFVGSGIKLLVCLGMILVSLLAIF